MPEDRPEFFDILGLAPPITVSDVKEAFLAKVKTSHPDHGGDPQEFMKLKEAFDQATAYAEFRGDRMKWLGVQVERYAAQEALVAEIESLGGKVEIASISWMKKSFGDDFAQLMDRITGVTLIGPSVTDAAIEVLVREQSVLQQVRTLDFSNSKISDFGVLMLRVFQELRKLNLRGTAVTNEALLIAQWLPELQMLGISHTKVNMVGKLKCRFSHPKLVLN